MDFWSRLIGGGKASSRGKNAAASNDPQQRLSRFKRSYSHTLQIWHKVTPATSSTPPDTLALETIQTSLRRMTSLLQDDLRAPAPHLCLSFAASSYVYTAVARIATSLGAYNEAIVAETTALFSALVDSDNDEEGLLATEKFAGALMGFIDGVMAGGVVGSEVEAEVLELMFGIAAKVRLEPELLPVWFRDGKGEGEAEEEKNNKKDFPLCHQFVGHVYDEGRAGDFARTGLLYIFEAASHSQDLEVWITDSDLPTLLATGLGALYSQLGRKLTIAHPDEGLPLILALSDNKHGSASLQVESFYSASLQSQLSTFMSYMVFWQDVLEHCQSAEIKQTLIDHFQVFFLQQILYPSLLESSDIDGGSSVAVLTYIWRILDSVNQPDIIHLILSYLLALPDSNMTDSMANLSPAAEKRRETLLDTANAQNLESSLSPTFFNLVDLIITSAQSRNPETVTAAMRLVTTILSKHHSYAVSSLLKTIRVPSPEPLRTVGSVGRDLDYLVSLAVAIGGAEGVDEAYGNSLKDALSLVEGHVCSAKRQGTNFDKIRARPGAKRRSSMLVDTPSQTQMHSHYLVADDPLLRALSDLLRTFFTNDVETNLGLTNVIVHLASCPYTRLDGWLIPDASKPEAGHATSPSSQLLDEPIGADDPDGDEEARIAAYQRHLRPPTSQPETLPPIMTAFKNLSEELARAKTRVPEMEYLVASRKRAFQGSLEIEAENELRPPTPGIATSSRQSFDQTRSSPRPSARQSPAPPIKRIQPPTPDTTPSGHTRGRSIASIVGGQRKPGAQSSPQRLSPRMSPSLRATDASSRRSSPSPTKGGPRALSPLSVSAFPLRDGVEQEEPADPSSPSIAASMEPEVFERRVRFSGDESVENSTRPEEGKDANAEGESTESREDAGPGTVREASLTHVLTNVVILQEFILELGAIIQVRASLLDGEVKFI